MWVFLCRCSLDEVIFERKCCWCELLQCVLPAFDLSMDACNVTPKVIIWSQKCASNFLNIGIENWLRTLLLKSPTNIQLWYPDSMSVNQQLVHDSICPKTFIKCSLCSVKASAECLILPNTEVMIYSLSAGHPLGGLCLILSNSFAALIVFDSSIFLSSFSSTSLIFILFYDLLVRGVTCFNNIYKCMSMKNCKQCSK